MKCSLHSVNTPRKAFDKLFTNKIRQFIIDRTNKYGRYKHNIWIDITQDKSMKFVCVLFTASENSNTDRPKNWFSKKFFVNDLNIKKIMSGRRFF